MINRFKKFIAEKSLFSATDKIIATVSGGIDSVVMLDLIVKSGYKTVVAHCNFNLRGDESDGDERFVRELARKYGVEFYSESFDTKQYAENKGISIQMAARELRYEWFERLRVSLDYDFTATAHNKNDVAETIIFNLTRGTGLAGLGGIPAKSGRVVRPLLFASRNEIIRYAEENKLQYREDSSNKSVKYKRNFIRHKVLPVLQTLNPSVVNTLYEEADYFAELHRLNQFFVKEFLTKNIEEKDNGSVCISKEALSRMAGQEIVLFEWLKEYGYNRDVCKDVIKSETGSRFFSGSSYVLFVGRNEYCLQKESNETYKEFIWERPDELPKDLPFILKTEMFTDFSNIKFKRDGNVAYFDYDKLKFPLKFRKWKYGDYFYPFGGKGKKKLSDFFVDNKIDSSEKDKIFLLVDSEGKIIWIVGYRIDDRMRLSEKTEKIFVVRIEKVF